jgi:hypothetical protein
MIMTQVVEPLPIFDSHLMGGFGSAAPKRTLKLLISECPCSIP